MSIVKLNNKAVSNATAFGSISSLGSMVFIKKLTASSSATLSFVHGTDGVVLDNTYKEYMFTFNNIHPSNNNPQFEFNLSTDGGSNYNVTKTSTYFRAYHTESGSSGFGYRTGQDLAQSTDFQNLTAELGNDNDHSLSGGLTIFNPSSSTFVKHFIFNTTNIYNADPDYDFNNFGAGYGNTTSAVNAIRFQMSSGNIDAGDICLYGIA
jgi:hypothetical protein